MTLHRLVFFIGGFDPRSPRHYHRLFRTAAAQRPATALGERVSVGSRERLGPHLDAWTVQWQEGEAPALNTRYTVMRWDDIVQRHWPRHWRQALRDHWHVYAGAGAQGLFGQVWKASQVAFWLALLPLGMGLTLLSMSTVLTWGLAAWAHLPVGLAVVAALVASTALWSILRSRLDTEWLLRLYGFTWLQAHDRLPDLEQRLDMLSDAVLAAARQTDAKEVLVVGHSTGSIMAVSILARACAKAPWLGHQGPVLSLLTLGHCTPILGWVPAAARFRAELALLATHPGLSWQDISAPSDWAAFANVPPWLEATGPAQRMQSSPRFHVTLTQTGYEHLLAHRHELHMQYLRAPQISGGYDPVVWAAGPQTLAQRWAPPATPQTR